jgi:3-mercaptopyruvate sulfurtransferase SseA
VALQLKRHGLARVRPLLGGLALWMEQKFPVEQILAPPGPE